MYLIIAKNLIKHTFDSMNLNLVKGKDSKYLYYINNIHVSSTTEYNGLNMLCYTYIYDF